MWLWWWRGSYYFRRSREQATPPAISAGQVTDGAETTSHRRRRSRGKAGTWIPFLPIARGAKAGQTYRETGSGVTAGSGVARCCAGPLAFLLLELEVIHSPVRGVHTELAAASCITASAGEGRTSLWIDALFCSTAAPADWPRRLPFPRARRGLEQRSSTALSRLPDSCSNKTKQAAMT